MKPLRHIFPGILLLTAGLFSYSCQKEARMESDGITLSLAVSIDLAAATKADTRPGDDGRNENVIEWVDLFLFSGDGGSGTEVFRTPYKSLKPAQDAEDPTRYTLSLFISNDRLNALFGTTDPGVGNSAYAKIVVVANGDAVSEGDYMDYPDAPSSMQAVRESVAKTNFNASYAENLSYLILCGKGDITLTHTDKVSVSGDISLARSYAKLDLALQLPENGQLEISGRTYQADLENMTIELLNVVHRGYVGGDATHIKTVTADDFLPTTNPRALRASGSPLVATHNCFYSYSRRFSDMTGKQTEYRISIPWRALDAPDGPVHTGYYTFPVADEESEAALLANHYYHTEAAVHTLGSPNQTTPETLEGSWTILDWEGTPIYGTFNDYEYLIAHPTWVSMHGLTAGTASYKSSTSLTSCTITEVKTYGMSADGSETSRVITNPTYLANYTVSHNTSSHTITLHHDLELEGDDMYYRQEITVTLHNNDGLEEVIVFEQTPPIEVHSTGYMGGDDNFFIDGYKMGETTGLSSSDYRNPPDNNSTMALKYNLRFTLSAFSKLNNTYINGDPNGVHEVREYIIGDPRITQDTFTTTAFNVGGTYPSYQWTEDELSRIRIADYRASSADWIAPDFITCTGYARATPLTLEELEMRAAMYQESGYPAGRWRLMTEAEYKFLVNLQIAGKIPTFFYLGEGSDTDSPYFTAQGTCYSINRAGTAYSKVTPDDGKAYARFVYDAWYWGPEPDPASLTTYNPQP